MNRRELVRQAERKVRPSTDNLIWIMPTEGCLSKVFITGSYLNWQLPVFLFRNEEETHMVKINGKSEAAAGMTVDQYLETANYDSKRIVVERNEEILPREQYSETILQDGDVVEIISFMGGG